MRIQIDKDIKTPKQYSKKWLTLNTCLAWFWISAYLTTDIIINRAEHINNIIVLLVTSIIGTIIPYYCKSYLETKEDKKMQLEQMKLQNMQGGYGYNTYNGSTINNFSEANDFSDMNIDEEVG